MVVFPHNFARHLIPIPTSCNSCIGMNVTNGLRLVLTNAHTTVIIYSWHRKVSSKNGIMVHNLVRKRALWFSVSSLCVNNMVRLWFIHNASIIATNVVKILLSIASPLCLWWWRSHKAMAMVVVVVIRKLWMCLHYHHFTSIRNHYTALFYSLSRFTINLCAICFWESDAADTQLLYFCLSIKKNRKKGETLEDDCIKDSSCDIERFCFIPISQCNEQTFCHTLPNHHHHRTSTIIHVCSSMNLCV